MQKTFMTWGVDDKLVACIKNGLKDGEELIIADDVADILMCRSDLLVIDFANLTPENGVLFGKLVDQDCFPQQHLLIYRDQVIPAKYPQRMIVWTMPRGKTLPPRINECMARIRNLNEPNQIDFSAKPFALLAVVGHLRKYEYASTDELAERCSLSRRTMQRYMQEFSSGWENITYSNSHKKWWMPDRISRAIDPEKFAPFPVKIE